MYPPDSEEQQSAVSAIAADDAFNWGYDPVHWSTPEGSYATNPDGPTRILEYRLMVQALHRLGLRVVFDTVYNHTFHSGVDGKAASSATSLGELDGQAWIARQPHFPSSCCAGPFKGC